MSIFSGELRLKGSTGDLRILNFATQNQNWERQRPAEESLISKPSALRTRLFGTFS
jgi:hypothetical protein